jgi:serine/threonine protein kinase/WD40 repeat protein
MDQNESTRDLNRSGSGESSAAPDSDELAIKSFFKELEEASNAQGVLHRYEALHPHLAREFHELLGMVEKMVPPPEEDDEPTRPVRLGDFRIIGEIGHGGMGMVYEAVQDPFQRRVAVKIIRSRLGRIPGPAQARFLREQEVLAKLHHTHIVPIHAAGHVETFDYYAMGYIEGASLSGIVHAVRQFESSHSSGKTPSMAEFAREAEQKRARRTVSQVKSNHPPGAGATPLYTASGGSPSAREATEKSSADASASTSSSPAPNGRVHLSMTYLRSVARVIADAADALQHAHEAHVLHRDLKPSNIMVDPDEHCWVVDFGLAALQPGKDGAALGHVSEPCGEAGLDPVSQLTRGLLGTPDYMAPEQFESHADPRTDVWGLGVTLYELLTLSRPFRSKQEIQSSEPPRPRDLVDSMPPDLEAICLKAIRKDPTERYASAGALRDDLQRWLGHEPIHARPARPLRRVVLWSRRNPGWAAAIAVALLCAAVGAGAALLFEKQHADNEAARARQARRALQMQQLTAVRLSDHEVGWWEKCWALVREISPHDARSDLQAEAAATLVGTDARTFKAIDFEANDLVFDHGGKRLLFVGKPRREDPRNPDRRRPREEVRVWDSETDETRALPQQPHDAFGPVTFGAEGTPLQLVWDREGRGAIVLWDLSGRKAVGRFEPPFGVMEEPRAWSITTKGAVAAALLKGPDESLHGIVWETQSGKALCDFPTQAQNLELSPDASLVATSDSEGNIVVWPVAGGPPIASLRMGRTSIYCMAFTRDYLKRAEQKEKGWLLAAGSTGGDLTIWDVQAKVPRTYCRGSAYDVYRVAFSPDGMTLASCGRDAPILWDVATGRKVLRLPRRPYFFGLAFTPDGKRLALGAETAFTVPGGTMVYDLEETRGQQMLRGLATRVNKVRYSPDGRYLAALAQNWQLAVWEVDSHRLLHVFETPIGMFGESAALVFDPEGKRLAFSTMGGAKMWDIRTGAEVASWPLQRGYYDRMAFPASDRLLLIRQESLDARVSPIGSDSSGRTSPRLCRVRNLLGPEPLKPLVELKDFAETADEVLLAPDGQTAVVEGKARGDAGATTRVIKAIDPLNGGERWSLRSKLVRQAQRIGLIDPASRVLTMRNEFDEADLEVELTTGRLVHTHPAAIDGPSSKMGLFISSMRDPGAVEGKWLYALFREGDEKALLGFVDWQGAFGASFSPDDQSIAWGNPDGTVTVFDVQKVRKKLAEVDLGW